MNVELFFNVPFNILFFFPPINRFNLWNAFTRRDSPAQLKNVEPQKIKTNKTIYDGTTTELYVYEAHFMIITTCCHNFSLAITIGKFSLGPYSVDQLRSQT